MEEIRNSIQSMSEMAALSTKYLSEIRDQLPQNRKECKIYALLVGAPLMQEICTSELDPVLVYNYIELCCEKKAFREMHMYLMICYLAMGMRIPPFFMEFSRFDDLLELLMQEMLRSIGRYVIEECGIELENHYAV